MKKTPWIKHAVISTTLIAFLGLESCSKPEIPLETLTDNQPSKTYTEAFWNTEQKANTALWQQAVTICQQAANESRPNCARIHDIRFFAKPLAFPTYGKDPSDKGFGVNNMPKIPMND